MIKNFITLDIIEGKNFEGIIKRDLVIKLLNFFFRIKTIF